MFYITLIGKLTKSFGRKTTLKRLKNVETSANTSKVELAYFRTHFAFQAKWRKSGSFLSGWVKGGLVLMQAKLSVLWAFERRNELEADETSNIQLCQRTLEISLPATRIRSGIHIS